tara:strand:- start:538 stop:1581 length:1044 start_codon:yes stop_codon:yes gene_type:complete
MTDLDTLNLKAFEIMHEKSDLYKSSQFWEEACKKINFEISNGKIDHFRKLETSLNFFVPTYGTPGNSFSDENISNILNLFELNSKLYNSQKNFLSGHSQFMSDYRVLSAFDYSNSAFDLLNFSESNYGFPKEHFVQGGKFYSRSSLNYLLGMSFLIKNLPDFRPNVVLEIGGGFGTLGEIFNKTYSNDFKYIDIDLPPIFSIAYNYIKEACELKDSEIHISNLSDKELISIKDLPKFSFLPTWEIEKLKGKIDLFVNFISFQEMEPDIVENYLKIVSSLDSEVILLRNMREGKQKAAKGSVGVLDPVIGDDFMNLLNNYKLIDTNVHPYGYATVDGFHSELYLFVKR